MHGFSTCLGKKKNEIVKTVLKYEAKLNVDVDNEYFFPRVS